MMQPSPPRLLSRKRKPDDELDRPSPNSPLPSAALATSQQWSASPKRFRLGGLEPETLVRLQEAHNATTLSQPPIRKLLSMLPANQLAGLICSLIEKHDGLQSDVISLIPRPTVATARAILERAEKAVLEAFPYHKQGPVTNSYSFNRVRPQLEELKDLLVYFLDFFVLPTTYPSDLQHEYPAVAFGYLDMATTLVHRLPRWQDPVHEDTTRGFMYRRLGHAWRVAIAEVARHTREGKIFGAAPVGEWAQSLHRHFTAVEGEYGFREASVEFAQPLGWVIGVEHVASVSSLSTRGHLAIMPDHQAHATAGHHYYRERTTVIEDDYECGVDGDCDFPIELRAQATHHTSGIVSKVKAFLLGPQATTDEIIVEKEVKIRRVHHSEQNKHDHHKDSGLKHISDSAENIAHKKLHDVKHGAAHLRDEIESETEEVRDRADSALSSIWSSLENAKARLDQALYGTEKKIDKSSHEYKKLKGKATDTYERARQRAHEDAERLRARANQGAEKIEEVGEDVASRAKAAATQVKGTIAKATDTAKHAKDAVKHQVEEVSEGIKHTVDDAANRVYDTVEATKDNIKDKAHKAKQGVKKTAHHVKEDVRRGVDSVKGSVEDGIHAAEDTAKGVYHKFEQAAECLGIVGPRAQGRHHGHDQARVSHGWDAGHHHYYNPVPVTAFYSALSCLWFLWLARRVWMSRNRSKVFLGDGSHELAHELHRNVAVQQTTVTADGRTAARTTALIHAENHPAIRRLVDLMRAVDSRATFVTNVPLYLVLLGALELAGAFRPLLHVLSIVFLAGNILQSEFGIYTVSANGPPRTVGLAINWAVLLFGSAMAIYLAVSCQGCPVS
ncbi:Tethering factor for nuclear proteasome sts1 [Geranomyces michiganensis]|nr:Tethering factor for nuclear proteasome sts1 [Geranomyces michiganensis]